MDHNVLRHSASCGRFQWIQVLLIQLPRFVSIWGIFLMLFGNYNPGWRCISFEDINSNVTTFNNTNFKNNDSTSDVYNNIINTSPIDRVNSNGEALATYNFVAQDLESYSPGRETNNLNQHKVDKSHDNRRKSESVKISDVHHKTYDKYNGTCDVIKMCRKIQFNPESCTIISEFGLICDKDWVPSLILTVVNAGFVIGSFVSGQVSERFGRKAGLYGSTLILALSSGAAVFSPNWETYTFFTFFIGAGGFGIISASLVFTMEFLNSKWRGYMSSRPVATLSLCVLSIAIYLLKSWRYLHGVTCAATSLSLLGYLVVTESPRWLFVNSYSEKGYEIIKKIAKRNKKPLNHSEKEFLEFVKKLGEKNELISSYSYLDILKTKEHLITTVKFSILLILELFIYHAFIFGVKSIPGDFYTNAVVSSLIQAMVVLSAGPISNFTGRRTSGFMYSFLGAILCVLIVTAVFVSEGYTQSMIIKISMYFAKAASQASISVTLLCAVEIFPTAIRSVGVSFVNGIACVGGLIAPYVIPRNGDGTSFAVCFSVMAFCFLLNGAIFYLLPETKDRDLNDSLTASQKEKIKRNNNDS